MITTRWERRWLVPGRYYVLAIYFYEYTELCIYEVLPDGRQIPGEPSRYHHDGTPLRGLR